MPRSRRSRRTHPLLTSASAGVVALGSPVTGYAGMIRPSSAYATGLVRPAATSGCIGADIEVTSEAQLRAALAASVDDSVICITESIALTSPLVIDDTSLTLIGRDDSQVILDGRGAAGILEADFTGGSHELSISRLTFINGLRNAHDSGASLQIGDRELIANSAG